MPAPKTNLPISDLTEPIHSVTSKSQSLPDIRRARRIRYITGFIALVLSLMPVLLIAYYYHVGDPYHHASAEPYRLFSMFLKHP